MRKMFLLRYIVVILWGGYEGKSRVSAVVLNNSKMSIKEFDVS